MVTINNPTDAEIQALRIESPLVVFCRLQEENAGTRHLQGYFEFSKRFRLSTCRSLYGGNTWHWEPRKKTQDIAIKYVSKERTRVENGVVITYGELKSFHKGSMESLVKGLKEGDIDIEEAIDANPMVDFMHHEKILSYALRQKPKRNWEMKIWIFFGPTGTGKSSTAELGPEKKYHAEWPKGDKFWHPDYQGEETVIWDDFGANGHQITMGTMMKFFDRYPMKAEWKGGFSEFVSKKIIVTTNIDPKDWYPKIPWTRKEPLERRIADFATIWDFTTRTRNPADFTMTRRLEPFTFNLHGIVEHLQGRGQYNFGGGGGYGS